jgi:prefoldin subunit 5
MSNAKLSDRLIKSGSKNTTAPPKSIDAGFYQNILHYPDIKVAAGHVRDYALNETAAEDRVDLEESKERLNAVSQHCEPLEKELVQLNDRKSKVPGTLKSGTTEDGKSVSVPFGEWAGKDKAIFLGCSVLMVAAMALGLTNAAVVFLASGDPVFLEAPFRAWLMGAIVPIAGASLKLPTSFIEYEVIRKRYALTITLSAAICLGLWAFFYALEYQGLTGGLNLESLLEPDGKSSYLVFFQLLGEVLASAALALSLENIYRLYCPDSFCQNPEYELLSKQIHSLETELKPLRAEKAELHARIVSLEANREKYAAERVAAYFAEITRRRNL